MDLRQLYLRRGMRQARLRKRTGVAAMLVMSASLAALFLTGQRQEPEDALATALAQPAAPGVTRLADGPAAGAARRVYPYSIVPGGVQDRAGLARAVAADKVVAAHYAGFAVDRAVARSVDKPRAVYVSYRKGGQVYWTANKVMLAEGETILSDGQSDIRGRCGNRMSDTPRLPVEARGPSEQELDTAVDQDGDGELREVAYVPEDTADNAEPFTLRTFANGAGLLNMTRAEYGPGAGAPGGSADQGRLAGSLTGPAWLVPVLGSGAAKVTTAVGQAGRPEGGAAAAPAAGLAQGSDSGGSRGGGDPAPGSVLDPGALPALSGGDASQGSDGGGGEPGGAAPPETLHPGGLPDPGTETGPADKPQAVPEPGGLWLALLGGAALLLQRRLHRGRPR